MPQTFGPYPFTAAPIDPWTEHDSGFGSSGTVVGGKLRLHCVGGSYDGFVRATQPNVNMTNGAMSGRILFPSLNLKGPSWVIRNRGDYPGLHWGYHLGLDIANGSPLPNTLHIGVKNGNNTSNNPSGEWTVIATTPFAPSANVNYYWRFEVVGSTIRGYFGVNPFSGTWSITATDTVLTLPGSVEVFNGDHGFLSNTSDIDFDDILIESYDASPPSAFTYGFGANSGGAGQPIVHVTNLNDSGAGSFRAATAGTLSNRYVVFDVQGNINLTSGSNNISGSNITVDGSTSPGAGISFTGWPVRLYGSNMVMTTLRHRGGYFGPQPPTQQSVQGYSNWSVYGSKIVLDHLSSSGWYDEAMAAWFGAVDITVQYCIFGGAIGFASHNVGPIIGGYSHRATFHHNLHYNVLGRNPQAGWGDDDYPNNPNPPSDISIDVVNNLIALWNYEGVASHEYSWVNAVGNYFHSGAGSDQSAALSAIQHGQIYVSGNVKDGSSYNSVAGDGTGTVVGSPFFVRSDAVISPTTAQVAAATIVGSGGAGAFPRDSIDTAVINALPTFGGTPPTSWLASVLADNPKLVWKCDEASGNLADSSGNAYTGTAAGGLTYQQTGPGSGLTKGIKFNGTTGKVTRVGNADLDIGNGPATIEMFFKRGTVGATQALITKDAQSGSAGYGTYLNSAFGGQSNPIVFADGAGTANIYSPSVTDTNWHHLAITRNTGSSGNVYLDGADVTLTSGAVTFSNNSATFGFGAENFDGTPALFFDGTVAGIVIYKSALSLARVQAHRTAGLVGTQGGAATLTGGGVVTVVPKGAHVRAATVLTGGGVVTYSYTRSQGTARSASATLTGGGTVVVVPKGAHAQAAVLTGGGVITVNSVLHTGAVVISSVLIHGAQASDGLIHVSISFDIQV